MRSPKIESPKSVKSTESSKIESPKIESPKSVKSTESSKIESPKIESPKCVKSTESSKLESPKSVKMKSIKTKASHGRKKQQQKPQACLTFNDHQAIKAMEGQKLPAKQLRQQRQQIKNQLQQRIRRRMMAKGQLPPNPTEEEVAMMKRIKDKRSFTEFLMNSLGNEYSSSSSAVASPTITPPVAPSSSLPASPSPAMLLPRSPPPAMSLPHLSPAPSTTPNNIFWLKGYDPYLHDQTYYHQPVYHQQFEAPVFDYAFSSTSPNNMVMMDSGPCIFTSPSISPHIGAYSNLNVGQSPYERLDLMYPMQYNPDYNYHH